MSRTSILALSTIAALGTTCLVPVDASAYSRGGAHSYSHSRGAYRAPSYSRPVSRAMSFRGPTAAQHIYRPMTAMPARTPMPSQAFHPVRMNTTLTPTPHGPGHFLAHAPGPGAQTPQSLIHQAISDSQLAAKLRAEAQAFKNDPKLAFLAPGLFAKADALQNKSRAESAQARLLEKIGGTTQPPSGNGPNSGPTTTPGNGPSSGPIPSAPVLSGSTVDQPDQVDPAPSYSTYVRVASNNPSQTPYQLKAIALSWNGDGQWVAQKFATLDTASAMATNQCNSQFGRCALSDATVPESQFACLAVARSNEDPRRLFAATGTSLDEANAALTEQLRGAGMTGKSEYGQCNN